MYKVASSNAQDAARRLKLRDLCREGFEPTQEQEIESIKAKLKAIEAQLATAPKKGAARAALVQEKMRLIELRRAIKPRVKGPDVGDCFIKIVKAQVTKFQYELWMKMAREMKTEADAVAESETHQQGDAPK